MNHWGSKLKASLFGFQLPIEDLLPDNKGFPEILWCHKLTTCGLRVEAQLKKEKKATPALARFMLQR